MEAEVMVLDEGLEIEALAAEMGCCKPQSPAPE